MTRAGAKPNQTYAPFLRRVLLLDQSLPATRLTAEILKDLGAAEIYSEVSDSVALERCRQIEPQLIITELKGPSLDGLKFVRRLRRSSLTSRGRPVIVITREPTAIGIVAARDSGVHEVLAKPFTIRDLMRRIEAVMLYKRDWIEAVNYVGPDRRRFNSGGYQGRRKRQSDPADPGPDARVAQAVRILASAIKAIESDPTQSLRAMRTQIDDLQALAAATGDARLTAGAIKLQSFLTTAMASGTLSRSDLERNAADLLTRLPVGPRAAFELI